ncbi:PQQ-binding-like beta-propeller repeat protein [Actinomadura nitritigenes]|uniref:outer membrane protein assembly factor BamB family protein n=1 Tax=Actinomadura nitritigenes TaxID=134602 RepID=UPI003D89B6F3
MARGRRERRGRHVRWQRCRPPVAAGGAGGRRGRGGGGRRDRTRVPRRLQAPAPAVGRAEGHPSPALDRARRGPGRPGDRGRPGALRHRRVLRGPRRARPEHGTAAVAQGQAAVRRPARRGVGPAARRGVRQRPVRRAGVARRRRSDARPRPGHRRRPGDDRAARRPRTGPRVGSARTGGLLQVLRRRPRPDRGRRGVPEGPLVVPGAERDGRDDHRPVRRRWAFAAGTDGRAAVRGGDVFVTLPRLTALDARTGAPRWQVEAGGTLGRLAICEDLLLAVDLDREHPAVHGWEAGTGKRRWEYPLPADEGGNPYRSVETAGDVFAIRHGSAIAAFQVT